MKVLFVGDGERDRAVIPVIVERILGLDPGAVCAAADFLAWKTIRLDRGSGYSRKMKFALARARAHSMEGLVCTVDGDRAPPRQRLKLLDGARKADREKNAPLRTAIGEARPHSEAWLLDDSAAVRQVLKSGTDIQIPSVAKTDSPKLELDRLLSQHGVRDEDGRCATLAKIADFLDHSRCNNSNTTGLGEFVLDVKHEFKS